MNEKKPFNWKAHLVAAAISLIIGAGLFCLFFFTGGAGLIGASNGTGFTAVILVCFAGLDYVARQGFFDVFSYGFRQFGTMIFGRKANQNNDYPGYVNAKKESRKGKPKTYFTILIVGALFLIAFVIIKFQINAVLN